MPGEPLPHFDAGGGFDWMASEKLAAHMPKPTTTGYIHSAVPGRTDLIHAAPPGGSYVLPADVVSGVGEGNSMAGAALIQKALATGPFGTGLPAAHRGGIGIPPAPPRFSGTMLAPAAKRGGRQAAKDTGVGHPTPILAAGGEFIVPPDVVAAWGGGDLTKGHQVLDAWVLKKRKEIIAKMKSLKPPKKS